MSLYSSTDEESSVSQFVDVMCKRRLYSRLERPALPFMIAVVMHLCDKKDRDNCVSSLN